MCPNHVRDTPYNFPSLGTNGRSQLANDNNYSDDVDTTHSIPDLPIQSNKRPLEPSISPDDKSNIDEDNISDSSPPPSTPVLPTETLSERGNDRSTKPLLKESKLQDEQEANEDYIASNQPVNSIPTRSPSSSEAAHAVKFYEFLEKSKGHQNIKDLLGEFQYDAEKAATMIEDAYSRIEDKNEKSRLTKLKKKLRKNSTSSVNPETVS
ncbi:hypothetical protein QAD02_014963 [Eretmocerus hayati]|uniref:Uncharacterized protein n=1 Tax=Eretmocerus hayati TaxID=131215 RepID=A0ACC2P6X6_9HYME|nr:hypothetical protein QAD02_014963 [Eretmocerus hayati]